MINQQKPWNNSISQCVAVLKMDNNENQLLYRLFDGERYGVFRFGDGIRTSPKSHLLKVKCIVKLEDVENTKIVVNAGRNGCNGEAVYMVNSYCSICDSAAELRNIWEFNIFSEVNGSMLFSLLYCFLTHNFPHIDVSVDLIEIGRGLLAHK